MHPWPELTRRIELDNRGLEPPEAMVRILTALKHLGDGEYILAHNDREPMFLYPRLDEMGYVYRAELQEDGSCLIAIRKPHGGETRP